MLAARKLDSALDAPMTEILVQPSVDTKNKPKVKAKIKPRVLKLTMVAVVGVSFCCSLYFSSLAAGVMTKGYAINNLKSEIEALETANERLRLEIARMDSLERVEALALAELGMKKPGVADYLLLPMNESWSIEGDVDLAIGLAVKEQEVSPLPEDERPIFQKKANVLLSAALDRKNANWQD